MLVQVDVRSKAKSLVMSWGRAARFAGRVYITRRPFGAESICSSESTVTLGREPDAMVMWGMPEAPITSATTFDPPSVDALAVDRDSRGYLLSSHRFPLPNTTTAMPSPPIQIFLTTIASQPALRQRQGESLHTDRRAHKPQAPIRPSRVCAARLAGQESAVYLLRPRLRRGREEAMAEESPTRLVPVCPPLAQHEHCAGS